MTRNLKALGLALFAMLALAASEASAAPKLTSANGEYPMTIEGSQSTNIVFTLPGNRKFECTTAKVAGTIASKAEAETSQVNLTPTYEGCTATILGNVDPATVTMNGCFYRATAATEAASGKPKEDGYEYTGKAFIECPAGKSIEWHVWETSAKHLANATPLCIYVIGPQGPLSSVDYKLIEKDWLGQASTGKLELTLSAVATTKSTGTLTNCGAASQTGTTFGGTLTQWFNSIGARIKALFDPS
jgi:hypothetical protein